MATYRLDSIEMPDGNEFEIPVFVAEYGVTPYEDVLAAYNAGRALICKWGDRIYTLDYMEDDFTFTHNTQAQRLWVSVYIISGGATAWDHGTVNLFAYPAPAASPSSSYYLTIAATDSMIRRSTIQFGSSTTQYLANNGTWQNLPSIPSTAADVGAIAAPSSPATGSFLVWNGSAWTAQTLSTWQGGNY